MNFIASGAKPLRGDATKPAVTGMMEVVELEELDEVDEDEEVANEEVDVLDDVGRLVVAVDDDVVAVSEVVVDVAICGRNF